MKTRTDFKKRSETIRNVEAALDRKLKVEKALVGICLRYLDVNLKNVVKCILEGDFPIVSGEELNEQLATALGIALENYDDEIARMKDLTDLLGKWSRRARKQALLQKPVHIPRR